MTETEFFVYTMNEAIDKARGECLQRAGEFPNGSAERAAYIQMSGDFPPLETHEHGRLGSGAMYAMGEALMSMSMLDWERFYNGYVYWAISQLDGKTTKRCEQENARGAMLLALKNLAERRQSE